MIAKQGGAAPQTLAAMVQALKKTPGAFSVGNPGEGTTGHLATLQLEKAACVQINSIPYKGAADAKLALMGGHVDYVILTTGEALDVGQVGSKLVGVAHGPAKAMQRVCRGPTTRASTSRCPPSGASAGRALFRTTSSAASKT
jgi:tripartite-type tricarboxylate transporter receptor subunit TctC